jgi:hypothetical protein
MGALLEIAGWRRLRFVGGFAKRFATAPIAGQQSLRNPIPEFRSLDLEISSPVPPTP